MAMYMYILIITHLMLKLIIHYKYTFILQTVTQTSTNHAFGDTAIELDYFS